MDYMRLVGFSKKVPTSDCMHPLPLIGNVSIYNLVSREERQKKISGARKLLLLRKL